ncbi:hypothetical protein [Kordiimonas sp.]|uniref:hypothetical protein n=1 Tax=Kordiimonas sp. TaxID=1970157 RepID=UPI003A946633
MVEINSNSTGLQSQLQAQLQANAGKKAQVRPSADLTPRPSDLIKDKLNQQAREQSDTSRQAPAQQSRGSGRTGELSSSRELQVASEKVSQLNANTREAPVGRLSQQGGVQRDVRLGQIIDIRV